MHAPSAQSDIFDETIDFDGALASFMDLNTPDVPVMHSLEEPVFSGFFHSEQHSISSPFDLDECVQAQVSEPNESLQGNVGEKVSLLMPSLSPFCSGDNLTSKAGVETKQVNQGLQRDGLEQHSTKIPHRVEEQLGEFSANCEDILTPEKGVAQVLVKKSTLQDETKQKRNVLFPKSKKRLCPDGATQLPLVDFCATPVSDDGISRTPRADEPTAQDLAPEDGFPRAKKEKKK